MCSAVQKNTNCERARARVRQTCGHLVDERILMLFIPRVEMMSGGACKFLHYILICMCSTVTWEIGILTISITFFFANLCTCTICMLQKLYVCYLCERGIYALNKIKLLI